MNLHKRQIRTAIILFVILLIIEILLLITILSLPKEMIVYSTPCSIPDFYHPFGNYRGGCIQVLVQGPKYAGLKYQLIWLMIITALAYLIYLIKTIYWNKKR